MAKPGKGKPHRSKPYNLKQAEKATAKRAAQSGRGGSWSGSESPRQEGRGLTNPVSERLTQSGPEALAQQEPGMPEREHIPGPSDTAEPSAERQGADAPTGASQETRPNQFTAEGKQSGS